MVETATESLALTHEQIKAMRAADAVNFRWGHDADEIVLSKDVERGDGFGRETLRVRIPARVSVTNYGHHTLNTAEEREYALEPAISGGWTLICLSVTPEWATMARFLRPGDTLVQEWVIDNRNTPLCRVGWTFHELKLRVERPRPTKRDESQIEVSMFLLDSHAEPAASSSYVTRRST